MTTNSDPERRIQLEQRANAVRSRLFDAVDALDRRRRVARDVGIDLMDFAVPIALGVSLLLVHGATRRRRLTLRVQFGTPKRVSWLSGIARTVLATALVLGVGKVALGVGSKLLLKGSGGGRDNVRALPPRAQSIPGRHT
jgi:hypothetical protein